MIATGVDPELDDLRRIALHGKEVLDTILRRETERTGIPSLKISYNNVFGYYIEVRNAHKEKVPEDGSASRRWRMRSATSPRSSRSTRPRFWAPRRRCC